MRFFTSDRDAGVDLLKGEAMAVEFAVVDVGRFSLGEVSEFIRDVFEDRRVPDVFVAGLRDAVAVEHTDTVELGLDEEARRKCAFVISILLGEHWFHLIGLRNFHHLALRRSARVVGMV